VSALRRPWVAPVVVFLVALVLRLAYVEQSARQIGLDSDRLTQLDTYVFSQWARVIADGDLLCWHQPHAYHLWTEDVAPESKWLEWYGGERTYHQAPLYAYFVAAVYAGLDRSQVMLGYVQAVLGALTCALTLLLARRLVSPLAGWAAGLMLALMGQFYFYDAFTLRDGPLALLTVALALTLDTAVRRGRARDWAVAGAMLGLFALAKETGLPMLLLALALLAWIWRREPRRVLRCGGLLLLGFALVTAPAFARNRIVGAPTFKLSTRGPEVVVVGNAQGQDGVGWDVPAATMRRILMDSNFSLGRTALLTMATHRAEPWGFVALQGHKTEAFFNGYEEPNNANFYLHRANLPTLKLGFVGYGTVSALALLGLLLGLPRRRTLAVAYLLLLVLVASVVALYVLGRFRVHVLPLMALFAGLSVDWIWRALRNRRQVALLLAGVPLAGLFWWTAPKGPANLFYEDSKSKNTSMMMLLLKSGNVERANDFYDQLRTAVARDVAPVRLTYIPAENTLDSKLAAIDEAFRHFREATRWADDRPEHHLALGFGFTALLGLAERYERTEVTLLAREQFELALRGDPEIAGAHRGLASVFGLNNQPGLAYSELNAELDKHPEDAEAWHDIGMLQLTFKDEVHALQRFREAEARGRDDDARMLAAMASIEVNTTYKDASKIRVSEQPQSIYDPELGLRHARRALELLPDDVVVMKSAADVLYVNGLHDEAVALLRRLAKALPERAAEFNDRAELFLTQRRNAAAKQPLAPAAAPGTAEPAPAPAAEGSPQ
jgi:4-amino-4-deoxy-L-arabinose transferase-like glycosyltransferase